MTKSQGMFSLDLSPSMKVQPIRLPQIASVAQWYTLATCLECSLASQVCVCVCVCVCVDEGSQGVGGCTNR